MHPAAVCLVVLFLPFVSVHAFAQGMPVLEEPSYTEGDSWEYRVVGHLDEFPGLENLTVSLGMDGLMTAQVTSVGSVNATLTWRGQLTLLGNATLPGLGEVTLTGMLGTTYVEERETPFLLATAFRNTAEFDLTIALPGFPAASGSATLETRATMPTSPDSPTYPLEEGELRFTTTATVASNLSFSVPFLGEGGSSSVDSVGSSLRIEVTPGDTMRFPFGTFSTVRLVTEALTGLAPSPFLVILPGSKEVAYHAEAVGNPVALRFLQNQTEVGNATLRAFSLASTTSPPFWQHPAFLGGLLALPVAFLLYRYWRERRKGL